MWEWIGQIIAGPFLKTILDGYKARLAAGNTEDKIAADLAARELAVQQAEIEATAKLRTAEIGHPWEPDKLMAYSVAILFGKIVVWDTVLGLGTTNLKADGWMITTSNLIVAFYFAKRGFENIARIIKR